jgi:predicted Ser/Thr protein kinase
VYITSDGRLMKFVLGQARQEYTALRNLRNTGLVPSFRNGNGKVLSIPNSYQNVASKMFGGNTISHMTAFLMGKVGGENSMTLKKYIQTHPSVNKENIEQRLRSAINTLGLKGISHGDMHQDNIIVEVDSTGRIRRMWLIDFGRSSRFSIGQTARNMFAVTRSLLVKRGQTPKLFKTVGLYGNKRNVPLHGTKQNSRIDPHMFMALTGKEYTRENEARARNKRLNLNKQNTQRLLAGVKNRPRVTSKPRARSATPARRPTTVVRRPNSVKKN